MTPTPRIRITLLLLAVIGVLSVVVGVSLYDIRLGLILGGVVLLLIAIDLLT
jgi:hypothetical protein